MSQGHPSPSSGQQGTFRPCVARSVTAVVSVTSILLTARSASKRRVGQLRFRGPSEGRKQTLRGDSAVPAPTSPTAMARGGPGGAPKVTRDRKSTRLNSSHVATSYAVFRWKKKKK